MLFFFLCKQLTFEDSFWVRDRVSFHLLFQSWDSIWLWPMHVAPVSTSFYVCQSCWVWKTLFLCCPPLPLAPTTFLPLLIRFSLSPERRLSVKILHLGLSVPKSLTLSTLFDTQYCIYLVWECIPVIPGGKKKKLKVILHILRLSLRSACAVRGHILVWGWWTR